ncbi:hypothetical protein U9M49_21395 [Cytobacillus sp. OWB-43]|uniref:hypothetical protein n=1 Tax=Cytobacillus sp. OWB-43 TaxID=3108468 RepID=UPI002AFF3B3E|nr:hypothetical protein [Cytobacillus sp. OWB-43]MEA1855621.1 hypothetical protein [Cytobacillus sp. OWB-43]
MQNAVVEELEAQLFEEKLKAICQRAYEQGLEDARSVKSLPSMMKKDDLAEYFQVSKPTVENIIRMDGFPKSTIVNSRYPRDLVIEWANKNVVRVNFLKGIR